MILAIASGKGGTGKTIVATSLARVAAATAEGPVRLLDCDVEAPNAALFLSPVMGETRETGILIPVVDPEICELSGRCAEVCVTGAIGIAGNKVLVESDLCSGCGSCVLQCPEKALSEKLNRLGTLSEGRAGVIHFSQGKLEVGQGRATPLILDLKNWQIPSENEGLVILDSPPGSSCQVRETLRHADYAILVTEPTPFGLHDLGQVLDVVRDVMKVPAGVIINRSQGRDEAVEEFCREHSLPILARIPFSRDVAHAYSEGRSLDESMPEIREVWTALLDKLAGEVAR